MATATTSIPHGPIVTVHRGWSRINRQTNVKQEKLATCKWITRAENLSTSPDAEPTIRPQPCDPAPCKPRDATNLLHTQGQRKIQFVNTTATSATKDPATLKLVRSHVMKGIAQGRRERKRLILKTTREKHRKRTHPLQKQYSPPVQPQKPTPTTSLALTPPNTKPPSPTLPKQIKYHFNPFPTPISPSTRHLLSLHFTQFAYALFPMEYALTHNPVQTSTHLEFSIDDDAVFHAMLFGTIVSKGLFEGVGDSELIGRQMGRAVGLVNARLGERGWREGMAVVRAVSCLAIGEALRGRYECWAIHMAGLKKIVEMKGGMAKLPSVLAMKLYRTDLLGSIDQVIPPSFKYDSSTRPTLYKNLPLSPPPCTSNTTPKSTPNINTIPSTPLPHPIAHELHDFATILNQTLTNRKLIDTNLFFQACYSIQYQLLSSTPISFANNADEICSQEAEAKFQNEYAEKETETAFRLAALVFMKLVLKEPTFESRGITLLSQKLKISVGSLLITDTVMTSLDLLLWMLFMGALSSSPGAERLWYVIRLVRVGRELGLVVWEDVKRVLGRVGWVGAILDGSGGVVWGEVKGVGVVGEVV